MSDHSSFDSLFIEAFRQIGRDRPVPEIDVKFYPYAGQRHTIRLRAGRVYVRISDVFKDAPVAVHRALAFILVAKLLSRKAPSSHDRVYREYAYSPEILRASDLARRDRGHKKLTSAQGQIYDLDKIFQRLNRKYFDGAIPKPVLTWSQRRTYRILGHHDSVHDTIVISKTLDSADVPSWFVDYIVYHEMLHVKHSARVIRGRLRYHTNAFRLDEQRFPYFQQAQDWLDQASRVQKRQRARAA